MGAILNQTTTLGKANTEMDTYSLQQYVEFIVAKPGMPLRAHQTVA